MYELKSKIIFPVKISNISNYIKTQIKFKINLQKENY